MTDRELLHEYVENNAQSAFEELVHRHFGWVSATSLRLTRDPGLAEDVTQAVFLLLSRKAASLQKQMLLSNWLFTVTRYSASNALRNEIRRRQNERKAAAMRNEAVAFEQSQWEELAPQLDELVGGLGKVDREALLQRFYQRKSYAEIGLSLRVSEEAARKRVSRAIEQLRRLFAGKGVTIGAAALGSVLSANLTSHSASAAVSAAIASGASETTTPILKGVHAMLLWGSLKPAAIAVVAMLLVTASALAVLQLQAIPPRSPALQAAAPATAPATRPLVNVIGIDGSVVDADDKPVDGVRIILLGRDQGQDLTIAAEVQSGADGKFQLPTPPPSEPINQRSRVLLLKARYGLTVASWDGSGIPEDPEQVRLAPATELRVRFVDADNQPVAGVRVAPAMFVSGSGISALPSEMSDKLSQTTDVNGAVIFKDLPQKATVRLEMNDDRFATLAYTDRKTLGETQQTDGGTIRLLPPATITGRVIVADTGKPMAGVRVGADPIFQQVEGRPERGGLVISDADGRYVLNRLRNATYTVALAPRDESWSRQFAAIPLEGIRVLPGEQSADHDIKLITGGIIQGRVTVAETGRPLPGLRVGAAMRNSVGGVAASHSTVTAEDGSFMLREAPGARTVSFQDLAPPGLIQIAQRERNHEVTVVADQTVTVNYELKTDPNPPMTGKVVDSDGRPVRVASVVIERRGGAVLTTKTDLNGQFMFAAVEDGAKLTARRDRLSLPKPYIVDHERNNLTLVLQKNTDSSALVHVQQADGTPIAGAKLTVIVLSGEGGFSSPDDDRATGPDGTYLFKPLDPIRSYVISVSAKGFGPAQTELRLEAGKQAEPKPLILPKADSFIAGIVLDENSQPVAYMEVIAENSKSGPRSAKTDITGHFRVNNIVPGEDVSVYARSDARIPPKMQKYPTGTTDAVILFTPTTRPTSGR